VDIGYIFLLAFLVWYVQAGKIVCLIERTSIPRNNVFLEAGALMVPVFIFLINR
jgi:hypothetical protein